MGRKVFISILGTGPYSECNYVKDNFSCKSRYIQIATLKYLDEKLKSENNGFSQKDNDVAIFFLTKKSETDQWEIGKTKEESGFVEKSGLKEELENLNLDLNIEHRPIVDGKNEEEIWEIFKTIYDEIQENDELYFDITHAFRYLPMLLLTLINYSKFLKRVSLKSITYGNFMVVDDDKPIMDLTAISSLQDWTFAAGQYLDSGNVDKIYELAQDKYETFANALKEVIGERQTCRGIDIISSKSFADLVSCVERIDLEQPNNPIVPIIDNIKSSFKGFDINENIKNGLQAAIWCFDNKLYQQSITILLETIISDVCQKNNFDWKTRKYRDYVVSVFVIKRDNIPQTGWQYKEKEGTSKFEKEKQCLETIFNSQITDDWYDIYIKTDKLRNDIDHAGMRQNAKTRDQFVEDMTEIINLLKLKLSC